MTRDKRGKLNWSFDFPAKGTGLKLSAHVRPEFDWGLGAVLYVYPPSLSIHLILGYVSLWWAYMTPEEALKALLGE